MSKRLLIVTAASFSVLIVIGLIGLLTGPSQTEDKSGPDHLTRDEVPDPSAPPSGKAQNPQPIIDKSGIAVIQRQKDGRVVEEFRYERLDPDEGGGEYHVVEPEAIFYLTPEQSRVIRMRADSGVIVAPDHQPQTGRFRDNLVITIYESATGAAADLSDDSTDVVMRIELDEADFDTTLGEVRSNSRVVALSPEVEFVGSGLQLVYNELKQRLEYLKIIDGESLTYRPQALSLPSDSPATQAGDAPATDEVDPKPVQYYRVTFDRQVTVRSADRTLDADTLTAILAYRGQSEWQTRRRTDAPASGGAEELAATPALQPEPATEAADTDEVVLNWRGPMVVEPIDERPDEISDEQDVFVRFEGNPIVGRRERGDRLTCAVVQYRQREDVIEALGSPDRPGITIEAPNMGTAKAASLTMCTATQRATLLGPGELQAAAKDRQFVIKWSGRAKLSFDGDDDSADPSQDRQIEWATFFGDVVIEEPRFTLIGQSLTAHFVPTGPSGRPQLESALVSGKVRVLSKDGAAGRTIAADKLMVETKLNDQGRRVPSTLDARGSVVVSGGGQELRAGVLIVDLADPDERDAAEAPRDGSQVDAFADDIKRVFAEDNVVLADEDGMEIHAEALNWNAAEDVAVLLGSPVRIVRRDPHDPPQSVAEMQIKQLVVRPKPGTELDPNVDIRIAEAEGPGRFTFTELTPDDPSPRKLHVTWQDGMETTYLAGEETTVVLKGKVTADSTAGPTKSDHLSAGLLTLKLADVGAAGQGDGGRYELRQVVAEQDVGLHSTRWTDAQQSAFDTRLSISGPTVIFDNENVNRSFEVKGKGTMLIEDNRSRRGPRTKAVPLSGQGVTLFSWQKSMTIKERPTPDDTTRIIMNMQDEMRMSHQPHGRDELVELLADELEVFTVSDASVHSVDLSEINLNIERIEAWRNIQIRDAQRQITGGREMIYWGDKHTVRLRPWGGRTLTIRSEHSAAPMEVEEIEWDVANDRYRVKGLRGQGRPASRYRRSAPRR